MPLSAGKHLGSYEILSVIGVGGMGVVYKARDTRLDRIVAIKVLPDEFSGDVALRQRFEREARANGSPEIGIGTTLFRTRKVRGGAGNIRQQYAVSSDGRFLIDVTTDDESASPISIVLNWRAAR